MSVKTVFFDLDGTLLPMEQDKFVAEYFKAITNKMSEYGYEPKKLIDTIWSGTAKMATNDGHATNETVFWSNFSKVYGELSKSDYKRFEDFYTEDFDKIKNSCGYNPKAKEIISNLKRNNIRLILATNPIFPKAATEKRICWAGLDIADFEFVTTYENSSYCKPSLEYYKEILAKTGANPEETLMVGNDVTEDMVAKELGMQVFLITDNLINKKESDISAYPHGGFDELIELLNNIK